jgi:hypothetical protein
MPDDPNERLLAELRRLAGEVDAVPDEVMGYARAALGWRRIDAELAELLSDSRFDPAPATTRSDGGELRALTFRASELEIALEISKGLPIVLLGQLVPPAVATIEVQRDDGTSVATTETDSLGRFRLELPDRLRIRLLVRPDPPARAIETSWLDL